jgi:hypothetical protein
MDPIQTIKDIIQKGRIEIPVMRSGMRQRIIFEIKRIKTPMGEYPLLYTDRQIDFREMVRIAQEIGLPVQTPSGTAFPKGKSAKDFIGLQC